MRPQPPRPPRILPPYRVVPDDPPPSLMAPGWRTLVLSMLIGSAAYTGFLLGFVVAHWGQ